MKAETIAKALIRQDHKGYCDMTITGCAFFVRKYGLPEMCSLFDKFLKQDRQDINVERTHHTEDVFRQNTFLGWLPCEECIKLITRNREEK